VAARPEHVVVGQGVLAIVIVIVIGAAKRREREDSQIEQRRCGVEWLMKS